MDTEGDSCEHDRRGCRARRELARRRGTERILGHELAGRKADGTPVLIEGQFGCGDCDFCREGRNNLCHQSTKMALGIMRDGGMVEQFKVPAHKVLEIPPGLNISDASL